MKRRYVVLGLAAVVAVSLSVPAIGGPSNPVASSSATAKQLAKRALKRANLGVRKGNAALRRGKNAIERANAAQSSANSAQSSANSAQETADTALAQTSNVSANDLDLSLHTNVSANNSDSPKTVNQDCPPGKEAVSVTGTAGALAINPPAAIEYLGSFYYFSNHAAARERDATAANWVVTVQVKCIRASG